MRCMFRISIVGPIRSRLSVSILQIVVRHGLQVNCRGSDTGYDRTPGEYPRAASTVKIDRARTGLYRRGITVGSSFCV